jgi:hypothetical protein
LTLGHPGTARVVVSAQPFGRATAALRQATALVQRRPLRGSGRSARLRQVINKAMDEEFRIVSQELRDSVKALHGAVTVVVEDDIIENAPLMQRRKARE